MQYMLDTNICIAIIKNKPDSIRRKLSVIPIGQVGISSIVLSELRFGITKSSKHAENEKALNEFLPFVDVQDYPDPPLPFMLKLDIPLKSRAILLVAMIC